jgi:hypothetical protein
MKKGNSGGIIKWKKCDVPWANPTSEIIVASDFRLAVVDRLDAVADIRTPAPLATSSRRLGAMAN